MTSNDEAPTCSAELDAEYLAAALARALGREVFEECDVLVKRDVDRLAVDNFFEHDFLTDKLLGVEAFFDNHMRHTVQNRQVVTRHTRQMQIGDATDRRLPRIDTDHLGIAARLPVHHDAIENRRVCLGRV